MEIKKISDLGKKDYDNLIDQSAEGTVFHKTWWLDTLKDHYKDNADYRLYGAYENGILVAALPIFTIRSFNLRFIRHPKLTPYLGSVFLPNDGKSLENTISFYKEINREFAKIIDKMGICLYYAFSRGQVDFQPYKWLNFNIGIGYTYIIFLYNIDTIWKNLNKKKRNDITAAKKAQLKIQTGDLKSFIELNRLTMNRQKQPVIEENLWRDIYIKGQNQNNVEIFTAKKDNQTLAALLLVWDKKRSYYLGGGIKDNCNGAMSLLIWEAIRYSLEELKLKEFDFEGSDVPSLEFFFRKFGGQISPIFHISKDCFTSNLILKSYNFIKKLRISK
jgi:hypothetical protein